MGAPMKLLELEIFFDRMEIQSIVLVARQRDRGWGLMAKIWANGYLEMHRAMNRKTGRKRLSTAMWTDWRT